MSKTFIQVDENVIELKGEDLQTFEAQQVSDQQTHKLFEEKLANSENRIAQREALLKRLGISEQEAQLLLG